MMMEMESWPGGAADGLNEMDLGGGRQEIKPTLVSRPKFSIAMAAA